VLAWLDGVLMNSHMLSWKAEMLTVHGGLRRGPRMGCEEVMEGWLSRPERRRRRGGEG
jgi:hypothetical protein